MHLDDLLSTTIEPITKGWPAGMGSLPLDEIGKQGWSLRNQDLALPALVLRDSAIRHNSRWMRAFLERHDVQLCPHGKTTMAPQLFARQLDDGAFGITVATVQQMRVCRRFGVKRVLMANQLVGRQAIREVLLALKADPDFDFYCLVDSVDGVHLLDQEVRAFGGTPALQVLLEGGIAGRRTGSRSVADALEVARAAKAAPGLALRGVEGFEGVFGRDPEGGSAAKVQEFLGFLVEIAKAVAAENLFAPGPVVLSAGGSAHFDQVTKVFKAADLGRETKVILRSGCYFSHDSGMYRQAFADLGQRAPELAELGQGLRPALEVWAYVQSRPEPGRLLATMGKRDVSFDSSLPAPERWFRPGVHAAPEALPKGHATVALNDQHAFLDVPAESPLKVGDILTFGISHPCTTFDKWQLIYVVDDDDRVIEGVRTFF
ncbi:MAG: amino acid deaminase [Alphaproteobacteria bacterium]|nr:amino acid deaminase [Alphaproteobacteria bacterium]